MTDVEYKLYVLKLQESLYAFCLLRVHLIEDNAYALQHHDLKEVKKAVKKAKAFETQKLVKKLKDIRKKSGASEEITKVERQLDLLKELDHELVATTALKTKLNKYQILNENEKVQAAISKELVADIIPATPGSDAAKMQSRVLSSKILASEIAGVVSGLKSIIQPPNVSEELTAEVETAFQRPRKLQKMDQVERSSSGDSITTYHPPFQSAKAEQGLEEVLDEDNMGWESGTVDEEYDEEKIGRESGSANGKDNEYSNELDNDEVLMINPTINSPPPQKTPPKPPLTQVSRKSTGIHSTFLPSLSVGFTRGNSDDSDLSESEVKLADIDIKKNRRGQRARRAIWEKKYGKDANHKKKEVHAVGLDHNEGSTRQAYNKTAARHLRKVDARWGQLHAVAAPSSAPQKPAVRNSMKRVEEKPMHPSWEAKRKLKEKESVGIVPSQGTKIKF
ncbi:hypothetical protein C0989_012162 [Termitomyces sp. Mn162]|nr:hypothetical protein C0989_012162 [Termitomyces sp. Mn162]